MATKKYTVPTIEQGNPEIPPLMEEEFGTTGLLISSTSDEDMAAAIEKAREVGELGGPMMPPQAESFTVPSDSVQGSIGGARPDWIERGDVHRLLDLFEERMQIRMEAVQNQLTAARINDVGLMADMVGGIFNCPKCGLRLNSPSLTGQRGGLYEHPFQSSPQLGGLQCSLIGRKFKAPIVLLQYADTPKSATPAVPLTAKSE